MHNKKYLRAAAKAVAQRIEGESVIYGVPLDPDVADCMGAFPEEVITLADMVEDGLLTVIDSGEVVSMSANAKTGTQKPRKAKRPPFHEEFANKIIERLQEGTSPRQIPWTPGKTMLIPHNVPRKDVEQGKGREQGKSRDLSL